MLTIVRGATKLEVNIESVDYGPDNIEFECRNSITVSINAVHPDFVTTVKKMGRKQIEDATINFNTNKIQFKKHLDNNNKTKSSSSPIKIDPNTGFTQPTQGAVEKLKNAETSIKEEQSPKTQES